MRAVLWLQLSASGPPFSLHANLLLAFLLSLFCSETFSGSPFPTWDIVFHSEDEETEAQKWEHCLQWCDGQMVGWTPGWTWLQVCHHIVLLLTQSLRSLCLLPEALHPWTSSPHPTSCLTLPSAQLPDSAASLLHPPTSPGLLATLRRVP